MVWATAWSFDRLRLWLEADVSPEAPPHGAVAHGAARLGLVLVWVYAGLVPKLLGPHPEELALSAAALPPGVSARTAVLALGATEVAFGLLLLVGWHRRWLFGASAAGTVGVAAGLVARPLSPLPLGAAMLALAAAGYATGGHLPSARRCITDRAESELARDRGAGATDPDRPERETV